MSKIERPAPEVRASIVMNIIRTLRSEINPNFAPVQSLRRALAANLQEAVGIDIDLQPHGPRQLYGRQPVAQQRLGRDVAPAFEQEPAPVAAAQNRQRRRRRSPYLDAL